MKKFIMLLGLTSCLAACTTVDNGTRGIFKTYGKATESVPEGFYWYNPWSTDVVEINVQQVTWNSQTVAYTKDVQQATVKYSLSYHLDPSAALRTYQQVGVDWNNKIVPPVTFQAIKNVFGQARAVEDAINNRQAVSALILDDLTKKLAKRGIVVDGFSITDVQFTPAFEQAVERKQVAVQDADTARNKTVEIQENAKQTVITANAEAESMKIKSQALSSNPGLTAYEAVQRWNGRLPEAMYGANAIPFIQAK